MSAMMHIEIKSSLSSQATFCVLCSLQPKTFKHKHQYNMCDKPKGKGFGFNAKNVTCGEY